MEFLISIVAFVFVIGVLILVHEFGHFIAARKVGVHVEQFAIGMGPKIFGWKRGETEYKLCALPIGGYVKMLAEDPDEGSTGDPREFQSRNRWERFIILVMGATFNILLAYLIWVGIFIAGQQKMGWLTEQPVVEFIAPDGPAGQAGIKVGDRIVSIGNVPMENWEQLVYAIASSPRNPLTLTVERDGQQHVYVVVPDESPSNGTGDIGIGAGIPPVISGVVEGGPADRAGLQEGDRVVAINGKPASSFFDIAYEVRRISVRNMALAAVADVTPMLTAWRLMLDRTHTLEMEMERDGERFSVMVSPEFDPTTQTQRIGIAQPPTEMVTVRAGFFEAFGLAAQKSVQMVGQLYDVLGKLITGRLSTKALSGPVEIAVVSGQAAQQGIIPLLNLMAFISLNLGIVNLLPLPVLDGGHITVLAIEGILRRDLNTTVKEWIMRFGVVLLLSLMLFIVYQDIAKRFFSG